MNSPSSPGVVVPIESVDNRGVETIGCQYLLSSLSATLCFALGSDPRALNPFAGSGLGHTEKNFSWVLCISLTNYDSWGFTVLLFRGNQEQRKEIWPF